MKSKSCGRSFKNFLDESGLHCEVLHGEAVEVVLSRETRDVVVVGDDEELDPVFGLLMRDYYSVLVVLNRFDELLCLDSPDALSEGAVFIRKDIEELVLTELDHVSQFGVGFLLSNLEKEYLSLMVSIEDWSSTMFLSLSQFSMRSSCDRSVSLSKKKRYLETSSSASLRKADERGVYTSCLRRVRCLPSRSRCLLSGTSR